MKQNITSTTRLAVCSTSPCGAKETRWELMCPLWLHSAAAKALQLCPTLCDPIDSSPPGSPVPGILQARTVELVAISFSDAWKWKVKVKLLSRVWLFTTPWTPLSMGFSRQEYWRGLLLPSPTPLRESSKTDGDLSHDSAYIWEVR